MYGSNSGGHSGNVLVGIQEEQRKKGFVYKKVASIRDCRVDRDPEYKEGQEVGTSERLHRDGRRWGCDSKLMNVWVVIL